MRNLLLTCIMALLVVAVLAASPLQAQTKEVATMQTARAVLNEIMAIPMKGIPRSMLAEAEAVAIIPDVVKIGFVAGGRHGRGVVLIKNEQGAWNPPVFITLTGGSIGWQAGVQATDVVLVFKTRKSVDGLLNGKFTIGVDAAAAAGPVGRRAEAATDAMLKSELFSYSRSRGLFAGVSIDGAALQTDPGANARYYGAVGATPDAVLQGKPTPLPVSAVNLMNQLAAYTATPTVAAPSGAIGSAYPATATGNNQVPTLADPSHAATLRGRLDQSSRQLGALLDDRWKQYLAMPAEVYAADAPPPSVQALDWSLKHFDEVAANPAYRDLAARPEFQQTHQLLREYAESLAPRLSPVLNLPPPPGE